MLTTWSSKKESGEFVWVFVQNKYSSAGATTKLGHADVSKALELLILEREILFDVPQDVFETIND